jgi:hypothetical protein
MVCVRVRRLYFFFLSLYVCTRKHASMRTRTGKAVGWAERVQCHGGEVSARRVAAESKGYACVPLLQPPHGHRHLGDHGP